MDEYRQEDAPEDNPHPVKQRDIGQGRGKSRRGTKGNRKEQARRYWLRKRSKRLLYLREYMRHWQRRRRAQALE